MQEPAEVAVGATCTDCSRRQWRHGGTTPLAPPRKACTRNRFCITLTIRDGPRGLCRNRGTPRAPGRRRRHSREVRPPLLRRTRRRPPPLHRAVASPRGRRVHRREHTRGVRRGGGGGGPAPPRVC